MAFQSRPAAVVALAALLAAAGPASAQTGLGTPGGASPGINTTGAGTGMSSPNTIGGAAPSGPGFSNPNAISNPGPAGSSFGSVGQAGGGMVNPGIGIPPPQIQRAPVPSGRLTTAPRPR